MGGMMVVGIAVGIGALLLIVIVAVISIYNGLVRSRNETRNAWAQIDVQLKRRHDLVPNLVETVKGYAAHESKTLESVIAARNQAAGTVDIGDRIKAETALTGALSRLMVVSEQYPDLKANQNFLALQEELTSTENKIAFARQFYNDSVLGYNNKIETFPSNLVASNFGFKEAPHFQVGEKEKETPQVKF